MTIAIFVALAVMAILGLGMLVLGMCRVAENDWLEEHYKQLTESNEERQRWYSYLRGGNDDKR